MDNSTLNLLVFTREFPVGMAGTKRTKHLLQFLISKGIKIFIVSYRSKILQPEESGIDNRIPYVNIGMLLDFKFNSLLKIITYYFAGLNLIRKHKRKDLTNILYCYGGANIENLPFLLYAKLLKYRIIFDICEDYTFFEDDVKAVSRFKIWTVKKLDYINRNWSSAIIVISTHLRDKYLKLKCRNVTLIPITAEQNHDLNKHQFNTPLQVLYAGSFDLKDGVKDIIDGFNTFNGNYKEAILVLTGKSDQQIIYRNNYRDYKNIIFKGYVPDNEFYGLLRNADVLCMCRTNSDFANAGFPFKLGEYLATGNPVIATRTSDVGKYLTINDAFLIEPNNPQQICNTLTEIISNPGNALKIGNNGMLKCLQYFSPEATGQLLYNLLHTLVQEQDPDRI